MNRADRCPGVLRPHRAEDGLMIRLRLPGGRTTGSVLLALGALADHHGNPALQLTTRAGIQLRGLPDPIPDRLVEDLTLLELLPDAEHERVRNIVCSPLTGIDGGRADLRPMITELDEAVLAAPALAQLSGRFLFALDDGRGDVTAAPFDLAYRAVAPDRGLVLVGGVSRGLAVWADEAVPVMVRLAEDFLRSRPGPEVWHVRDLPGFAANYGQPVDALPAPGPGAVPLGVVAGAASVLAPLGILGQDQITAVHHSVRGGLVIITPWRGLVLPGAAERLPALVGTGLIADPDSPWTQVSACVGAPHCARTELDTHALATSLVEHGEVRGRTHVSGCERRCGAPSTSFHDVLPSVLAAP